MHRAPLDCICCWQYTSRFPSSAQPCSPLSCHAVRYRFVLDPDSGVWDTFKHAREDMNDWRFDLLMTILPIALWYILCLVAQTALVLYAGMLGRVLAEVLPVPILAYAIMTLLLALDDIDTPEEAETAAPKEA